MMKSAVNVYAKGPYGAILLVQDGEANKTGQTLATWDPHTRR